MAITVCGNCIEFGGSYTMCSTAPGFSFDGVIKAESGFCDTRARITAGFVTGGYTPTRVNTIQCFPFAADASATDTGELSHTLALGAGLSSLTNGYNTSGLNPSCTPGVVDSISKFSFASGAGATCIGNLLGCTGYSATGLSSQTDGYVSGGVNPAPGTTEEEAVKKFPFASDTNAAIVATFPTPTALSQLSAPQSIVNYGDYSSGYWAPGRPVPDCFVKFTFASDTIGAQLPFSFGPAPAGTYNGGAQSSTTHGYYSGGRVPGSGHIDVGIGKFPFASEDAITDVGELTVNRSRIADSSSVNNGYNSGGYTPTLQSTIDKFPFATDNSASDVGELISNFSAAAGHQF